MRIVLVDDQQGNLNYLKRILVNYKLESFLDPGKAFDFCVQEKPDLLITDQKMAIQTGLQLVEKVKAENKDIYAIIISAYTETEDLIDAINMNLVYKYLVKPFSPDYLLQNVHRALEMQKLERERNRMRLILENRNIELESELSKLSDCEYQIENVFAGNSPDIRGIRGNCRLYAGSDRPVMITGETGTGKEVLARAIHRLSSRSDKPFVTINCAALNETLLESELFGYRKGAFTDARTDKQGIIETADGGTLFLDEIGDASHGFQARLLRVIQFGTFIPVGGVDESTIDVRIISATNSELNLNLEETDFRQDLFYRLSTHSIKIPPLRERTEDLEILIKVLCNNHGLPAMDFSSDAVKILKGHNFPGNIRELENILFNLDLTVSGNSHKHIEKAQVLKIIEKQITDPRPQSEIIIPDYPFDMTGYLADHEKNIITRAFNNFNNNISKTARALSLSRQGLRKKLVRFNLLDPKDEE